MNANIPELRIAKAGMQQIAVGEIQLGATSIGKLVLSNMHVGLGTGTAKLRNFRVTISITWSVDWAIDLSVNLGITNIPLKWSGSIALPPLSLTLPLGDLDLPGLQSLDLDLASLSVTNITAVVGAIKGLNLGPMVAEGIRAQAVVAPQPAASLTGIGLALLRAEGLTLPGATTGTVSIDKTSGGSFPIPSLTLPALSLPSAAIGDIRSGGVDASGTSNPYAFNADAGVLKLTLNATPSARIQLDSFELAGVNAAASVGSVELHDVTLPFDVLNLTLSQIGIEGIDIPKLEVTP
jgi:hypothetical protein